jgi:hypothetical protein
MIDDLNDFEKKIQREINEASTTADQDTNREDNVESIKSFLSVKAKLDPLTHVKGLKNLISTDNSDKQAKVTIDRIKVLWLNDLSKKLYQMKKIEETSSRKEREQNRRKLLLGEKNAREQEKRTLVEDMILDRITKLSKQERRIAEQYVLSKTI